MRPAVTFVMFRWAGLKHKVLVFNLGNDEGASISAQRNIFAGLSHKIKFLKAETAYAFIIR